MMGCTWAPGTPPAAGQAWGPLWVYSRRSSDKATLRAFRAVEKVEHSMERRPDRRESHPGPGGWEGPVPPDTGPNSPFSCRDGCTSTPLGQADAASKLAQWRKEPHVACWLISLLPFTMRVCCLCADHSSAWMFRFKPLNSTATCRVRQNAAAVGLQTETLLDTARQSHPARGP
jgi:hypothetical protein